MNNRLSLNDIFPIIQEQLESGGSAVFTIHGVSMLPMLKDGESKIRIIKPTKIPKKYDIIFYRRDNGQFVLHRIVGIRKNGFICRGDNQIENEFPVSKDSVIGILTGYTKNGKWKDFNSFGQFIYSRRVVNTVFYRRAKHWIKKKFKDRF